MTKTKRAIAITSKRKKKSVSKKLKRLLRANNRPDIIQTLKQYPNGMNFFDISNTDRAKISYLKGDRIPTQDHLLYDKEYRKSKAFHCKVGKVLSKMEVDPQIIQEVSAIFYNNAMAGTFTLTDDIVYWYNARQYADSDGRSGNLFCSCMRHMDDAIGMYEQLGSDVVKLLVMKDKENKVIGRALVWFTVTELATPYMDRVYFADENIQQAFFNYAEKKGWARYGRHCGELSVDVMSAGLSGDTCTPYMDTFQGINDSFTMLSNYSHDLELTSTEGYTLYDLDNGGSCECDYCGDRISDDEYYFIERHSTRACDNCVVYTVEEVYECRDDCAQLANGEWTLVENTVYSNLTDEYIHQDNAVYLEYCEQYVHTDNTEYSVRQEIDLYREHAEWSDLLNSYVNHDDIKELEAEEMESMEGVGAHE